MKRIIFFISFLSLTTFVMAQSPGAFNYQAVVRDAGGQIMANQTVSFRISILIESPFGDIVFGETHDGVNTSDLGLVNLEIGRGEYFAGLSFNEISWEFGSYFIQIELDETGGTNYQLMGVSQLLTVPYALHATTAEYALNDADADPTNEIELPFGAQEGDMVVYNGGAWQILSTGSNGQVLTWCNDRPRWTTDNVCPPQIGDFHEGGIVFYLDASGEHGLVAAESDLTTAVWGCELSDLVSVPNIAPDLNNFPNPTSGPGSGIGDGQTNTAAIVSACTQADIAATLCFNLEQNGYDDWFLPSIEELDLMYTNLHLNNLGNFTTFKAYWSSTEMDHINAWLQEFSTGQKNFFNKANSNSEVNVRAVRAF